MVDVVSNPLSSGKVYRIYNIRALCTNTGTDPTIKAYIEENSVSRAIDIDDSYVHNLNESRLLLLTKDYVYLEEGQKLRMQSGQGSSFNVFCTYDIVQ